MRVILVNDKEFELAKLFSKSAVEDLFRTVSSIMSEDVHIKERHIKAFDYIALFIPKSYVHSSLSSLRSDISTLTNSPYMSVKLNVIRDHVLEGFKDTYGGGLTKELIDLL